MINFSTLQGVTIPEGVVTQIADASGRVLWMVQSGGGGDMVFTAYPVTATTYAGETSYADEQFILLDVYPKANGTVSVTYGGLTKTVTDTSGVEEPNAIQVFFGTFNGVSDGVETPASGELIVSGDYRGVGQGSYSSDSKGTAKVCACISAVTKWGNVEVIPDNAFKPTLTSASKFGCVFLEGLISIGSGAFSGCTGINKLHIPSSVTRIGENPWRTCSGLTSVTVAGGNTAYILDQECLIEIETGRLIFALFGTGIPSYVTSIDQLSFYRNVQVSEITLPQSVVSIGNQAFSYCTNLTSVTVLATTPPTAGTSMFSNCSALTTIIVPAGCGDAYKAASVWSTYADIIVEAS